MVLGIAIAVNGAALMAVNAAMVEGAERIVIVAKRLGLPASQTVASQNCPAPKVL